MHNYHILSFILRVNVAVDGKNAWDYRKEKVFMFLKSGHFDMIGFQEVTPSMYQELKAHLVEYQFVGIGRDKDQEAIPIFFKKNKYKVLDSNTLWLSNTPHVESRVEGSHFPRIVTYVVLEDENQNRIAYFNTHLDYSSEDVCEMQAIILSKIMEDISFHYKANAVLSGDFNQLPESKAIKYLSTKYQNVFSKKERLGLTFHNFSNQTEGKPIDYFFYSKDLEEVSFQIIHHQTQDFFLSDHYPLIAEFKIKK